VFGQKWEGEYKIPFGGLRMEELRLDTGKGGERVLPKSIG